MNGFVTWLQDAFRWLVLVVVVSGAACVLILPLLYLSKRRRPLVGVALVYFSYLTGFTCWIFCFIITYRTLGRFWLVVGVVFGGIGVFPLAVIGEVSHGLWSSLPDLLFAIAMMALPRMLGLWIIDRQAKMEQLDNLQAEAQQVEAEIE